MVMDWRIMTSWCFRINDNVFSFCRKFYLFSLMIHCVPCLFTWSYLMLLVWYICVIWWWFCLPCFIPILCHALDLCCDLFRFFDMNPCVFDMNPCVFDMNPCLSYLNTFRLLVYHFIICFVTNLFTLNLLCWKHVHAPIGFHCCKYM